MTSCKKDGYQNDGGQSKAFVNMTTYDFLSSQPVFDSLVRVIDHAGMKDAINGDITFFATTNYGVADFVQARKIRRGTELGNENLPYTVDSLPVNEMKDSLKMYMFAGKINRDQMTVSGQLYNSILGPIPNVQFLINLRRTQDYSAYVDHVDYVRFTKVIGSRDDLQADPGTIPATEKDMPYDCQTSGIITTTGIIHVLSGGHRLFFNTERLN
jgi:hypothetical protein